MAKRRKTQTPIALLWTRRDQRRFIDAVEKFVSTAADLHAMTNSMMRDLEALTAKQSRRRRSPATSDIPPANGDAHEKSNQ